MNTTDKARTPSSIVNWRVQDLTVTSLSDGSVGLELGQFLKNLSLEEAVAAQKNALRAAGLLLEINCFLVRSPRQGPILIDCGIGGGLGEAGGRLVQALELAGLRPSDIETVLLTHLHADHAGGLIDSDGNAFFEKARIGIHRTEYAYWVEGSAALESDPDGANLARRALGPYAGRIDLFDGGEVVPGIEVVPLHGHTPGHVGYRVGSGETAILIWGDIVGMPHIQSAHPEAGFLTDYDSEKASNTRREIMEQAAERGFLVAGMHIEFPGVANVVKAGSGYRLVPAQWVVHQ